MDNEQPVEAQLHRATLTVQVSRLLVNKALEVSLGEAHQLLIYALRRLEDLSFELCPVCGQDRVSGWPGSSGKMCKNCAYSEKHGFSQKSWQEFHGRGLKKLIKMLEEQVE
ncbi:hypothetical protein LCGC14_1243510 [marine sediment metagenome]|uniref:Uncharacterized protein n=1 Tax=marine sediment metagenome TaxID=412755 RepID=A0A0F9P993_9ZZZZ